MAKPRIVNYTFLPWSPRICAVDDAWFEGGKEGFVVFDVLHLSGLHNRSKPLHTLQEHLGNNATKVGGDADARYLRLLTDICVSHGFTLSLCNFEGLDAQWDELNVRQTAILLDLNYSRHPTRQMAENYGLQLIHGLLKGDRPTAEVFVVTGGPEAYNILMKSHSNDASWWPVRAFPVIAKFPQDDVERDLNCFARYFKQGNMESPIVSMLQTLVRAQLDRSVWSHPPSFDEVPKDLPLRNLYEDEIMNIKALYHWEQNDGNKTADYWIAATVLAALLSTSKFHVAAAPASGTVRVLLPWAPFGVLWVAQAWLLLYWLKEENKAKASGSITINSGYVVLTIPLSGPNLANAIGKVGEQGKTIKALDELKRVADPVTGPSFQEILGSVGNHEKEVIRNYIKQAKIKGRPGYSVTVDEECVRITWQNQD